MNTATTVNRDGALGAATLALALVYGAAAARIPESVLADAVGPRGLPLAYAVFLAAVSVVLIAGAFRGKPPAGPAEAGHYDRPAGPAEAGHDDRPAGPAEAGHDDRPAGSDGTGDYDREPSRRRPAGLLLIGVAYLLVVPWSGYVLALAALILATSWYLGAGLSRRTAAVALGGALLFWLLFVWMLRIPQPAGLWPSLL